MNAWRTPLLTGLVGTLALTAGCALIDRQPEPLAFYDLRSGLVATAGAVPVRWQLIVDEPTALEPVSGVRIATRTAFGSLGVLADGRWSGTGPQVLQAVIVDAFRQSGRIVGVTRLGAGAPGNCTLISDLRDFQYEQGSRSVRVSLAASLVCGPRGGIVASRTIASDTAVEGSGIRAIVAAYQRSVDAMVPALVDWVLAAGEGGRAD